MKYFLNFLCFFPLSLTIYSQYPDAATIKKNKIRISINTGMSGSQYTLYDENGMEVKSAYEDEDFKNPTRVNKIFYNEKSLPDSVIGTYINDHYQYAADGSYTIISKNGIESDTAFYGKDKKIIKRSGSDGSKTKYEYNTKRQLIKAIKTSSGDISVTTYVYNTVGLLQSDKTTGADTGSAVYTYDKKGLLIKKIWDYGIGSMMTTSYSYKFRGE